LQLLQGGSRQPSPSSPRHRGRRRREANGTSSGRQYACRHKPASSECRHRSLQTPTPWVSDDPHVSSRLKPRPGGAFLWGAFHASQDRCAFSAWPANEVVGNQRHPAAFL